MIKMAKTYQINVIITSEDDEDIGEDWVFDVTVPDKLNLTPYEIVTAAKNGAVHNLLDSGVKVTGETH